MFLYCIAAALCASAATAGFSLLVSGSFPPLILLAPAAMFAALAAWVPTCGLGEAILWTFVAIPISIGFLYRTDIPDPLRIYVPAMLFTLIIGKSFAGYKKEFGS
jgi:hypothetical protein